IKAALIAMVEEGMPANVAGEFLEIPTCTISRWTTGAVDRKVRYIGRKNIIEKWYTHLQGNGDKNNTGLVSLDGYLDTYNDSLLEETHLATDMLFMLFNNGVRLPYNPQPRDAYIFGANEGNGSLNSNFTMQFSGTPENTNVVDNVVPIVYYGKDDMMIAYSPALGRLFYTLGLRKGERKLQDVALPPDWIRGKEFVAEYLGALFDTIAGKNETSLGLTRSVNPKYSISLKKHVMALADMFMGLGIELTERGITYTKRKDIDSNLDEAKIWLKLSEENIRKIRENLRIRFKGSKEYLDQKIERYRAKR
ncbi:MAG: hypothetical protein ABIJ08_04475, partial [Nanoarchaeota archaeon]